MKPALAALVLLCLTAGDAGAALPRCAMPTRREGSPPTGGRWTPRPLRPAAPSVPSTWGRRCASGSSEAPRRRGPAGGGARARRGPAGRPARKPWPDPHPGISTWDRTATSRGWARRPASPPGRWAPWVWTGCWPRAGRRCRPDRLRLRERWKADLATPGRTLPPGGSTIDLAGTGRLERFLLRDGRRIAAVTIERRAGSPLRPDGPATTGTATDTTAAEFRPRPGPGHRRHVQNAHGRDVASGPVQVELTTRVRLQGLGALPFTYGLELVLRRSSWGREWLVAARFDRHSPVEWRRVGPTARAGNRRETGQVALVRRIETTGRPPGVRRVRRSVVLGAEAAGHPLRAGGTPGGAGGASRGSGRRRPRPACR